MKAQLHKLLDLVLEANEKGIDLSLDIRPNVVISICDARKVVCSDFSFYEKTFVGENFKRLDEIIELTEQYIKNYEHGNS